MSLSSKDVKGIAELARLTLTEAEIPGYAKELAKILALVDQLAQVDTNEISPLAHPLETSQRLRADCVAENDQRDYVQKIAPAVEAGLYIVPQVIE